MRLVDGDPLRRVRASDAELLGGMGTLDLHGGMRQLHGRCRRPTGFLQALPPVGLGRATCRAKLVLELCERVRAALLDPRTQLRALALAQHP